jgi:hypothetical protein
MAYPTNWPSTLTDLANRVVSLLGENQTFSDITTDTTDNGVLILRVLYDTIRDTQSAFPWPELATFTNTLTQDTSFDNSDGAYPFSYRYSLPDDYLRPINEELYNYRIIGPYVYADVTSDLNFHYIKYDETVTNWSAALYRAVIYRTAMSVCLTITQSEQIYERLLAEYEKVVEPECYRIRSYSQEHPNTRRRNRGEMSTLRNGHYYPGSFPL